MRARWDPTDILLGMGAITHPLEEGPCHPLEEEPCRPLEVEICHPLEVGPCHPLEEGPCHPLEEGPCCPLELYCKSLFSALLMFVFSSLVTNLLNIICNAVSIITIHSITPVMFQTQ